MLLNCTAFGSETCLPMQPQRCYIPAQEEKLARCVPKKKLEVQIQCHLWKAFPGGDAGELAEEREAEEDATTEESPQASEGKEPQRRRRRRLRDADGVYITLAT